MESRRAADGSSVQRQLLHLGEINDTQEAAWRRSLEALDENGGGARTVSLFADNAAREHSEPAPDELLIRMGEMSFHRPRAFGNCFVACRIWEQLGLDAFWKDRLGDVHRGDAPWHKVLQLLAVNRLIDPGSEWRIHRQWLERSAMDQLLSVETGAISKDRLYRCLDRILEHREALFAHLTQRWMNLFDASFDILLYDLTSTYFEGLVAGVPKAVHGYSRDGRPDCRQVVIALVVTPDGLPVAYEVMPGNTSDKTTLEAFLDKIERQYGKARRTWLMDRGIPTEKVLEKMRGRGIDYLVGTPKGKLRAARKQLAGQPWKEASNNVDVKLYSDNGELLVLARSAGRKKKERAIRRRRIAALVKGLAALRQSLPERDHLLQRIGALRQKAGRAARFVRITIPNKDQAITAETFFYAVDRKKYKEAALLDGHYLLRTSLTDASPESLWAQYMQLTRIEAAFRNLKSDLQVRPIFHFTEQRVEAHIFVAFLGYCLLATLQMHLRVHAAGLTAKAALESLATILLIDVHAPVAGGKHLVMRRYTQPDDTQALLLEKLRAPLPNQPPPRIFLDANAAAGVSARQPKPARRGTPANSL